MRPCKDWAITSRLCLVANFTKLWVKSKESKELSHMPVGGVLYKIGAQPWAQEGIRKEGEMEREFL